MTLLALIYLLIISFAGTCLAFVLLPFPRLIKLLLGPSLGIILTTELILILSLLFQFNTTSILLSLTLMILLVTTLLLFRYRLVTRKPQLNLSRITCHVSLLKFYWPLILILTTIGPIIFYIFWTKVLSPTEFGLVTGGGGLYGDTALHAAYTSSLLFQGLPPKNALFAGKALVYPFLVDLFSASLMRLGLSLRFAFILPQLVYFIAFTALFYWVAKTISTTNSRHSGDERSEDSRIRTYSDPGQVLRQAQDTERSRSARMTGNLTAFFTMLIFFLGWGLGFMTYYQDVRATGSWQVTKEYTNNLESFNLHNPLTGLIFPERSFLPGLVIGLLITALMLGKVSNVSQVSKVPNAFDTSGTFDTFILIGLLLGILPLWHTHTFIFFGVSIGIWLFLRTVSIKFFAAHSTSSGQARLSEDRKFEPVEFRSQKNFVRAGLDFLQPFFFTYLPALFLSLPVIWWFNTQLSHDSFTRLTFGWMDSGKNFLLFWLQNAGLLIPLALVGIFLLPKDKRLFFLPVGLMFVIANLIQFQPWDWDNIKLLTWVFLFLAIPAGQCLSVILGSPAPRNDSRIRILDALTLARMTIALVLLFSLTLSGSLSLIYQTSTTYTIYDQQDLELADWVKQNTKPTDIFLIDPWPNHPIPGLTGRSAYLGYPGHLWVHGIKYNEREALAKKVLAGNVQVLSEAEVPINYVVVDTNNILAQTQPPPLTLEYENVKWKVFGVKL